MRKSMKSRKPTGTEDTVSLNVELSIPEGLVSQYVNHITVQSRSDVGKGEVTINFWQMPAYTVNVDERTGKAFLLGSYVMDRDLAERLIGRLAAQIGYPLPGGGSENEE